MGKPKGGHHQTKNTATTQDVVQPGMDNLGPDGQDREESARPVKRITSENTMWEVGDGDIIMPSEEEGSSSVVRPSEEEWSSWDGEDPSGTYTTPEAGSVEATEIQIKKNFNMEAKKKEEEETK